ncbi:hypothetical protein L0Y65_01640 [Candidatus Micrarchaeota archaeon]|nr:hypothetical protein [Candidatus Micrarchaeota archaeon]
MFPFSDRFVPVNSYLRIGALATLTLVTFLLALAIFPFAGLQIHFFQIGIFLASFIFGPIVGGAVGALTSSYNALIVINNPWIIGGNFVLGVAAAYLYTKTTPFKAALGAFAIQLPYVVLTDIFLVGMPVQVVGMIALSLFLGNILCATIASSLAPHLRAILAARA